MDPAQTVRKLWDELGDTSIDKIKNFAAVLGALTAVGAFFKNLFSGVSSVSSGAAQSVSPLNIPDSTVIQVGVFILVAVAIGWSFAALAALVSSRFGESGLVVGHILSVFWVCTLIGFADILFANKAIMATPLSLLFSVIGVCVAVALAKTNLKKLTAAGDIRIRHQIAGMIATFTGAAVSLIILQQVVA
ncbi:MAG: hypothetical protein AAGF28_06855 [Pseudomonadota bacterium]